MMLKPIPSRNLPLDETGDTEQVFLFPLDWTSGRRKFIDVKSSTCKRNMECMKDPIFVGQGRAVMNDLLKNHSELAGTSEYPPKITTIDMLAESVEQNEKSKAVRAEEKKHNKMNQPGHVAERANQGPAALQAAHDDFAQDAEPSDTSPTNTEPAFNVSFNPFSSSASAVGAGDICGASSVSSFDGGARDGTPRKFNAGRGRAKGTQKGAPSGCASERSRSPYKKDAVDMDP